MFHKLVSIQASCGCAAYISCASLSSQPKFLNQAAKLSSLHIVRYRHRVFDEEKSDDSHEIEDSLHKMRLLNVKTMKLEEHFGSSDSEICHPITLCTIKLSLAIFEAKELTVVFSSGAKRRLRLPTSMGRTGEKSVELGRSSTALLNA